MSRRIRFLLAWLVVVAVVAVTIQWAGQFAWEKLWRHLLGTKLLLLGMALSPRSLSGIDRRSTPDGEACVGAGIETPSGKTRLSGPATGRILSARSGAGRTRGSRCPSHPDEAGPAPAGSRLQRKPKMRILLIEDDEPTRSLIRRSLTVRGHSVREADRAATGDELARTEDFDVLIIDIQLPDGDGLEICRQLRLDGVRVPILFLTARGAVGDRVAGLDAGADDYLRKPFALAELDARVRALGRRQGTAPPTRLVTDGLEIDFAARVLRRDGAQVPMTAREWRVLEILASRAGRVVRRDELLSLAWGDAASSASESLDVIMSRIRRKLGRAGGPGLIRTVRGEGYVLELAR